ncbi:MAG TPA: ATP-binding protein [Micromonosporaceae bacterium]|nr:ATP-binding protein [Micromonosporaceae bacterium]
MRFRTVFAGIAVVGVALLVGAVALVASLHAVLVQEVRAATSLRAAEAARMLQAGADPVAAVSGDDDVVLQVLGPAGEVLRATPNAAGRPALARPSPGQSREVEVAFDDDTFLAVSVAAGGGRTVLVAQSLDAVGESTQALAALLAIGVPVVLLVVGATTWRVVGRALAPVDAIRAEVDSVSAAQLHRRVPQPAGQDEISRLAGTMNRMLDRLERARVRERRFIADASHELRSPIAAIRQHAEVALAHPDRLPAGELARTAHAESLRMQALVEDLLLLAQADEHALPLRRRPVDLDDLVLEEVQRLRAVAGVAVDPGGVSAARVDGDPAALRRVLRNLGENAARHARSRVAFALSEWDGWAQLHVDDDGPGVPVADRSRVFERFVRLDEARTRTGGGSGLGLAIVAEIVGAHGGTAVAADAPLGGARMTVRLPLSRG